MAIMLVKASKAVRIARRPMRAATKMTVMRKWETMMKMMMTMMMRKWKTMMNLLRVKDQLWTGKTTQRYIDRSVYDIF